MSQQQRNYTVQTYTYRDEKCVDLMPPEEMGGIENPIPEDFLNTCATYPECAPYNTSTLCTYDGKEQLVCYAFRDSCNCSGIGIPFFQRMDVCTPNPNNKPLFNAPPLPTKLFTKTIRVYNATLSKTTDNTASTDLLLLLVLPVLSVILAVVFLLRRKQGGSSTPSADDFDNIDWGLENDQHNDGGHGQEPAGFEGSQTTVVQPIPKQARQESAAAVTSSGPGPRSHHQSPDPDVSLALSLLDTSDSEESDLAILSPHRIPHRVPVPVANDERARQHLERMKQSQRKRMNGY